MANPNPVPPPVWGQWKPGQSGNPSGRPKRKPATDALIAFFHKLDQSELDTFNAEVVKKAAMGDVQAWEKVIDRVDGKVSTPIGGADDLPDLKIQAITRTIIEPALELEAESSVTQEPLVTQELPKPEDKET